MHALKELRNIHGPAVLRERLAKDPRPRTTLSFYRYVRLADPVTLRDALYAEWDELGVLGRTYLAGEGINAQISVPSEALDAFRERLDARPEFAGVPFKIALEEQAPSFLKLTIKVRPKLVADGLADEAFDLTNVGEHLDAATFNRKMEEGALVVDMRNHYECLIGHFEGALLPKAETFREAVEEMMEQLEDRKHEPVLLYCTGGIRCEKASAWFRHQGFTQVGQLHGGIIDYARQVKAHGLESRYKGRNFVFDGRLAERVTEDVVGTCFQCGKPSDRIANCLQETCNVLLVQCEACAERYHDCCSPRCREVHDLPEAMRRIWRKGKRTRSARQKVVRDPEALRARIAREEEVLAAGGSLHPELTDITFRGSQGQELALPEQPEQEAAAAH
ncbi:MAG: rhodanese-related sulfurtransferase [Flavobacteriales bacterium]|nr:rhodanese-related sulfurtransferase [Flavobacteriales bacterium]